jgi:phage terminase small subunit
MSQEIKKFPAPKKDLQFVKYWEKFLPKIIERDNFHESHLEQLEILCDLYITYHKLDTFLTKNGYSYSSDGRYGQNYREFPEVKIQQKCVSEIRQYSKTLGLLLAKDSTVNEAEKNEWE